MELHPDLVRTLITEDELKERISELGEEIARDYRGKNPLLIGILKGAVYFMTDLSRALPIPLTMDFMAVSSYGAAHKSSGVVRILKDLDTPLTGRHVLVVEDVLDTGLTLKYLVRSFEARGAASVEIATCLVKEGAQAEPVDVRYVGFTIPNEFVVGYGLDYAERYRNLPYVGVLKPSCYTD